MLWQKKLFLKGLMRLSLVVFFLAGSFFDAAIASEVQPSQKLFDSAATLDLPEPIVRAAWTFDQNTMPPWRSLADGLDLGLFPARVGQDAPFEMVILRIDPAKYIFGVYSAPKARESLPLSEWAARNDLVAVINASMYLPDGVTSTGYLRSGQQINNGRIVKRFGAFLVADPDTPGLPGADLLDRATDDWEVLLPHYRTVVQNYRLISSSRRLLWNPGGPLHSIAAVGKDGEGNILFILCREPLTGVDFGNLLLSLPMDVRLVMYTEGGSQAGLFVRTPALQKVWMGRYFGDILIRKSEVPLPNVIGIRSKP